MVSRFETRSLKRLVDDYLFENDRTNREDAEMTQKLIKAEMQKRFNSFLRLLDDPQSSSSVGAMEYLLREGGNKRWK